MEMLETLQVVLAPIILMWLGWATRLLTGVARETHDLHAWHRPSDDGVQEWKNPQIRDAIEELTKEVRGMRKDMADAFRRVDLKKANK